MFRNFHHPAFVALLLLAGCALPGVAGCGSPGPVFIGPAWNTDLTPIKDNDVQKFFSPSLKFSVKFNQDGTLVSSWTEDGKQGTKTGTWTMVDGDGLRWTVNIKLASPEADEMEVRLVSRSNRGLAIESLDAFRNKGGAVEFRRG